MVSYAIMHNYISGFNSLPASLVPDMIDDMTDAIAHNYISGFMLAHWPCA